MKEAGCFVDESYSDNLRDRYCLVALVLHTEGDAREAAVSARGHALSWAQLKNLRVLRGGVATSGPALFFDRRSRMPDIMKPASEAPRSGSGAAAAAAAAIALTRR